MFKNVSKWGYGFAEMCVWVFCASFLSSLFLGTKARFLAEKVRKYGVWCVQNFVKVQISTISGVQNFFCLHCKFFLKNFCSLALLITCQKLLLESWSK